MKGKLVQSSGVEVMGNVRRAMARMDEIAKLGDAGVGQFVPYNTNNRSNRMLTERYGKDRQWAWIGMLGGYVRLAPNRVEDNCPMVDMKPGEWMGGDLSMRLHGFGGCAHPVHGPIKVRLSDQAYQSSFRLAMPSLQRRYKAAPPLPPDPEAKTRLVALQDAVRGVYEKRRAECPAAAEEWMAGASEAALRKWLVAAGEEVAA